MDKSIEIQLDVKLLPQLIVISVLAEMESGTQHIFNFCCMAKDAADMRDQLEEWAQPYLDDGYKIVKGVITLVPRGLYA